MIYHFCFVSPTHFFWGYYRCILASVIAVHDLKTLQMRTILTKTKGSNTFAVNQNIENIPLSQLNSNTDSEKDKVNLEINSNTDNIELVPVMVTRVAVAVRKKLQVYRWNVYSF